MWQCGPRQNLSRVDPRFDIGIKDPSGRERSSWSQDAGFGLLLLIDKLVPDWRARLVTPAMTSPLEYSSRGGHVGLKSCNRAGASGRPELAIARASVKCDGYAVRARRLIRPADALAGALKGYNSLESRAMTLEAVTELMSL